jgi:hypothetical protein
MEPQEYQRQIDNTLGALREKVQVLEDYMRVIKVDKSKYNDGTPLLKIVHDVEFALNECKQTCANYATQ